MFKYYKFLENPKIKLNDFENIKKYFKVYVPNFHLNGEYLKRNGMKEGEALGKVLKPPKWNG